MTPIVRCSPSVAPRLRCLSWYRAGLLTLVIVLGGCAQQIRDRAEDALRVGDYEKAVSELEQGLKRYPDSPVLRAGAVQARNEGVARLVAESSAARAQRRLEADVQVSIDLRQVLPTAPEASAEAYPVQPPEAPR